MIRYPGSYFLVLRDAISALGPFADILWKASAMLFMGVLSYAAISCPSSYAAPLRRPRFVISGRVFIVLIASAIAIVRLPSLAVLHILDSSNGLELNPDECQWIVGAATLLKDPRCWISVDGLSSGPLNLFLPAGARIFGEMSYVTVRLWAMLVCIIPGVIFSYLALRTLFEDRLARIAILPAVVFFSFPSLYDLVIYSSEYLPILATALSFYFFAKSIACGKRGLVWFFLLGTTLGSLPYTKVQTIPIAAAILVSSCVWVVGQQAWRVQRVGACLAGFIVPSIAVVLYVLSLNARNVFWNSFILNNFLFPFFYNKQGAGFHTIFSGYVFIISAMKDTALYFGVLLSVVIVSGLLLAVDLRKLITRKHVFLIVSSVFIFLCASFAVACPGNRFLHYYLLLIIPGIFAAGIMLGTVYDLSYRSGRVKKRVNLVLAGIVCVVIGNVCLAIENGNRSIHYVQNAHGKYPISPISLKIREYAAPGEYMAVWGWANKFYMETELLQGTRYMYSYWQTMPGRLQEYFLELYADDLLKNKPAIFLDVTGKYRVFYDFVSPSLPHTMFAPVKEIVVRYYTLADTIDNVRIYVLKSRLPRINDRPII